MKRNIKIIVPVILSVILAAGGCSKEEEKPTFTGEKTEEPEYQANLNAINPSAYGNVEGLNLEPGTYISLIGKDMNTAYWENVKAGAEQAVEDLNNMLGYSGDDKIKVVYNAPEGEDIDEQVNILDEELARYPDAVGIASIDEDAYKVQFDSAAENGIPIVAFDSGSSYQGIQSTCKTDNQDAAKTAAYQMCNMIQDQGKVLMLVTDSNSETAKDRAQGFKDEITNNHPEVEIVEILYCDQMDELKKNIADEKNAEKKEEDAEVTAEDFSDEDVIQYYLEKHPDINAVFGTNVTATQLGLSVLQDMEKADEITVVGFDAGKDQVSALEKGEIDGLIVQNPFGIGYATVAAAARAIEQTGNEAEVNTGYVWVTQENLEEESIQSMLYE